jgi:hypothetical protein
MALIQRYGWRNLLKLRWDFAELQWFTGYLIINNCVKENWAMGR